MVDNVKPIPNEPEPDFLWKETMQEMESKIKSMSKQTILLGNKLQQMYFQKYYKIKELEMNIEILKAENKSFLGS